MGNNDCLDYSFDEHKEIDLRLIEGGLIPQAEMKEETRMIPIFCLET